MSRGPWLVALGLAAFVSSTTVIVYVTADAAPTHPMRASSHWVPTPAPSHKARPFVGVIVAPESADLASKVEGPIAAFHARVGQHVRTGDLLATISSPVLRRELRTFEVAERTAEERRRRLEALVANRVAAEEELVQAGQDVELARARTKKARAAIDESMVRAPFEGTVVSKYADTGSYARPGTPLLRLVASGQVRIRFAVPPHETRSLAPGARLVARVDEETLLLGATVTTLSSELEPSSRMAFGEAEISSSEAKLDGLVGRSVKVSLAEP